MRIALAAILLIFAGGVAAEAAQRSPALRLSARAPLAVHGSGFAPRERVRVRLLAPRRQTRRVRATRAGSFRATFSATADRCSTLELRAIGRRGSTATLKVRPLCPPP